MFSHFISEAITFPGGSQPRKSREFPGLGGMTSTPWNGNSKGVGGLKQKCPPSWGVWIFSGTTHRAVPAKAWTRISGSEVLNSSCIHARPERIQRNGCRFLLIILITFLLYRFEDLMNNAPLPEYTRRDGSRNLVSRYTTVIYFYLKGCVGLSLKHLFFLF